MCFEIGLGCLEKCFSAALRQARSWDLHDCVEESKMGMRCRWRIPNEGVKVDNVHEGKTKAATIRPRYSKLG